MTNTRTSDRRLSTARAILLLVGVALIVLVGFATLRMNRASVRFGRIDQWMTNPAAHPDWQIAGGQRCGDAPFLLPTSGFIGVAWDDGLPPLYRHTGYDIFGPDGADNVTPIVAAHDGYLSREAGWRSAVIIRHDAVDGRPDLTSDGPIWTYYTHMASRDGSESFIEPAFPPGTQNLFVAAGTLLGYQGSWSGSVDRQLSRHLHFSVVKSDGNGSYLNETRISNTIDLRPLLGLEVNTDGILTCPND